MDNKEKDKVFSSLCYLPYVGFIFSILNFFISSKNADRYRVFHMYHSFFYWISIFLLFFIISLFGWLVSGIPFMGKFLVYIFNSIKFLIHIGSSVAGLFMAYMVYHGSSFSIPYLTEHTHKYLSDRKILP